MSIEIKLTNSFRQTKKMGEGLAKRAFKKSLKKEALVLALEGELGGGKTAFLQGFARGLGIKEKVLSPTFVILKSFKITKTKNQKPKIKNTNQKFKNFYHIDCYRIQRPKEILDLGFQEIISNPENIVAVEWADRIKKIIPSRAVWIKFEFIGKTTRKIMVK